MASSVTPSRRGIEDYIVLLQYEYFLTALWFGVIDMTRDETTSMPVPARGIDDKELVDRNTVYELALGKRI